MTAIIRYCFSRLPAAPSLRPWQIITAVDAINKDRFPPSLCGLAFRCRAVVSRAPSVVLKGL
jgi:hypothetical protein